MFKEALKGINERTEGALGSLIMGTDGIAVEKVILDAGVDANIDVAAAEITSLVRNAQRAGENLGHGALQEVVICYKGTCFLMRLVTRDYFIVLAMREDGIIGRGRFELRKAELELAKEFAL